MATYNYEFVNDKFRGEVVRKTSQDCMVTTPLKAICHRNAYVFPFKEGVRGEVVTADGITLASDFKEKTSLDKYDTRGLQHGHKAVFIGSLWIYIWGHCFTDHFNKVWFVLTDECRRLQEEGAELVYISCTKQVPNYIQQIFRYAGVDLSQARMITEPTQYEELYVPENCYFHTPDKWHRFYTTEYLPLLENIRKNVEAEAKAGGNFPVYEKIYLTRTQGKFGSLWKDLGEKAIEQAFAREGYTVIAPEKHTVAQQFWMMMNCRQLVATDGSICHASCFCCPHTKATVLCKADFLVEHQIVSNQIANLDVTYVSVHHSFFVDKKHPWHGPYLLCVTSNLEQYLGHKIPHTPYFLTMDFVKYLVRKVYVSTFGHAEFINNMVRKQLKKK